MTDQKPTASEKRVARVVDAIMRLTMQEIGDLAYELTERDPRVAEYLREDLQGNSASNP